MLLLPYHTQFYLRRLGFTIIETIIALVLMSIMSVAIMQHYYDWQTQAYAKQALSQIIGAVNLTRQLALINHSTVTSCLSRNNICVNTDAQELIISMAGRIIMNLPLVTQRHHITWHNFPLNKPWLSFTANGTTDFENGSFQCTNNNQQVLWILTVSQAGVWHLINPNNA